MKMDTNYKGIIKTLEKQILLTADAIQKVREAEVTDDESKAVAALLCLQRDITNLMKGE